MKLNTFRSRIIVTVVVVVSLFSSFAFYLYSNYLSKRIYKSTEENTIEVLDLINEPSRITYIPHNSTDFKALIDEIHKKEMIIEAYFIDSTGNLKYPENISDTKKDSIFQTEILLLAEDVTFKTFKSEKETFSRAFIRLHNIDDCYSCHSYKTKNLGFVIFDFSINQTQKNINFTRKFSISFTVFMVIILGAFVLLLHYRFVRRSLTDFQKSIRIINSGNLNERVAISGSKELGELAGCFNKMLDNFQETRKQLNNYHEKELQDAQKLATIGEMAARLAHEIRNPITGIANAIEIIVEDTEDEQHKPILQEIKRQANRVNEAISKLLKYSGSESIQLKEHNINDIIKSIVFFLKNQSGTHMITFVMELEPNLPLLKFDKEKVENVFLNLSLNSIQAIENEGVITFYSVYDTLNKTIEISVEDTGIGIPKDKINEVFKPFYTTKTEGTGLGMSIIKDTIDKHGGRIMIDSELGFGTKVTLVFPFL